MNCQNHPESPATAYCRTCGMPVCEECRRDAFGTVYCAEHAPAPVSAQATPMPGYTPPGSSQSSYASAPGYTPPGTPPPGFAPPAPGYPPPPFRAQSTVSPALAFFLGMIPGVGAIYNGQYAKGLVHAIVWGLLMSIANSRAANGLEPIFVMLVIAWWAYMAFEAHRTAQKLQAGEAVDEYSSLVPMRGRGDQAPVAGVALVVLGTLLLLRTLDVLDFERVARYWPVLLIALGVYLLWGVFAGHDKAASEARHER
ncbi:MAG: B-box zinc finger protein [Bryobacteraceae bacterium]|jgi:hypothetical protein